MKESSPGSPRAQQVGGGLQQRAAVLAGHGRQPARPGRAPRPAARPVSRNSSSDQDQRSASTSQRQLPTWAIRCAVVEQLAAAAQPLPRPRLSVTSSAMHGEQPAAAIGEGVDADQPAALAARVGGLRCRSAARPSRPPAAASPRPARRPRPGSVSDSRRPSCVLGRHARPGGQRGGDEEQPEVLVVDRDADARPGRQRVDQRAGDVGARRSLHRPPDPALGRGEQLRGDRAGRRLLAEQRDGAGLGGLGAQHGIRRAR